MNTPKPTPHVQNWQVQQLDGTSVSDHLTEAIAKEAALVARTDLQVPLRVRRTA